jgi:hypothetical protein
VHEAVQTMSIILLASRSEAVQRSWFFEIFVVGIVDRTYVSTTFFRYRSHCERLVLSSLPSPFFTPKCSWIHTIFHCRVPHIAAQHWPFRAPRSSCQPSPAITD